jgi:DNA-binding LacI/PurR family transcriptional regulator
VFTSSVRYSKLSQQVAKALEEDIRRGIWREVLPGERHLAEAMQVSRRTVRAAVGILRQRKILHTAHGAGTKILRRPGKNKVAGKLRGIGLLLPEPLTHLRSQTMVFIDSLRTLLYVNGFRLDTHIGQCYFTAHPAAALEKLTSQFLYDGWVLAFANRANQEWFHARGIPTVLSGTADEQVPLPFVDMDMFATCHHAASYLLRKGHRRIALFLGNYEKPGDQKSEAGFLEGARHFGRTDVVAQIFKHSGDPTSIHRLVGHILRIPKMPTAWFICNPHHYIAVASVLADCGVSVPRRISLLSRDDDPCLHFLSIVPSRYVCRPETRAQVLFSTLMRAIRREPAKAEDQQLLMPEFIEGASVADLTK